MKKRLVPTILCGGAGSRLWPISRETHPKPFIRLSDGESLLQKAWLRGAKLRGVQEVLTVTNRELFFKTQDEYRELQARFPERLSNSYILEPFGRNTAAAVASAALHVAATGNENDLLLVLAADHLIHDQQAFEDAVEQAVQLASQGRIVTFGIRPEAPETGYGYIRHRGNEVLQFVEKPDLETARAYLEDGNYLWNSGMFCFSAETMLRTMEEHCPDILSSVKSCLETSHSARSADSIQLELDSESFERVPDDSIDFAVMEKASVISVVPCRIGWTDVGSLGALGDLCAPDARGNRIEGEALLQDVSNTYIRSGDRLVAALGVDSLIIIDTPDALLVAHRDRMQEVKKLYNRLKAQDHEVHKYHRTVHRPWGTYTVLEEGESFKIKRIEVKPGATLSLQMHHHRSEHWIVVSGVAKVTNGSTEKLIGINESTYIPAGHRHRLENPGVLKLVMIEVQSGEYLGEDDIVRFDDQYGRVTV